MKIAINTCPQCKNEMRILHFINEKWLCQDCLQKHINFDDMECIDADDYVQDINLIEA